jgi:hypothetical protein
MGIMKMKIKLTTIFPTILILLLAYALLYAAETVAIVLKSTGTVSLMRGEKATAMAVKMDKGSRLQDGDKIVTGDKSFAAMRFVDDNSTVRIRANSTCRIKAKKQKDEILKNVYLEVGALYAKVTQQRGKFEISTPTSVASVKGTEWISEQKFEEMTLYHCLGGVVEVSNDVGTALARAGETVEVADDKTAPVTRKTKPGEGVWSDGTGLQDNYEFEFENQSGEKKLLKFEVSSE